MEGSSLPSPFVLLSGTFAIIVLLLDAALILGSIGPSDLSPRDLEWENMDIGLGGVILAAGVSLASWAIVLLGGLWGLRCERPWAGYLLKIVAALTLVPGALLLMNGAVEPALVPPASGGLIWLGVRADLSS